MKFNMQKYTPLGMALVLSFGLVHQASAHEQIGGLTLTGGTAATGAGATDDYVVTCFSDPLTGAGAAADHLFFQIKDTTGGGNLVGMTVINPAGPANAKAVTTVDPIGGDATYSQGQKIAAGNGDYTVTVWHTGGASAEGYSFTFHCQAADGITHTGTSILRVSNQ